MDVVGGSWARVPDRAWTTAGARPPLLPLPQVGPRWAMLGGGWGLSPSDWAKAWGPRHSELLWIEAVHLTLSSPQVLTCILWKWGLREPQC